MGAPADEADFLDLLIASERVEEWLEVVQVSETPDARLIGVLREFLAAVSSKPAYGEEVGGGRLWHASDGSDTRVEGMKS